MKKLYLFINALILFSSLNYSQGRGEGGDVPLSLPCIVPNSGQPATITCNSNTPVTIGNNIPHPSWNYSWFPSTGLNSPTIANPTAFPPKTTTYTLTATPINNLFTDHSFESRDFFSWYRLFDFMPPNGTYIYTSAGLHNYGFRFASNPKEVRPHWVSTSPTHGNTMVVVDGHNSPTSPYHLSQVPYISPNTNYTFSGQFINLLNTNGYNDPNITIKIKGFSMYGYTSSEQSFSYRLTFQDSTWHTINIPWQSGPDDYAVEIELYNSPTVSYDSLGNDFGYDNFSFSLGNCPIQTSSVTVTVNQKPTISPSGTIEWCYIYDAIVPLTLTSSPSDSYQWYKNGVLIPGATQQTLTEQNLGWDPITFQPRNLIYTVANSCGISDPVTVIAKATGGVHPYHASYSATSYDFMVNLNPVHWWDPNFSITHSIDYPGTVSNITDNNGYRKFNTNIQSGVSYPSTYRFTMNLHEFGCTRSYKYDVTITGNPQPTIVRLDGAMLSLGSSIKPFSENVTTKKSIALLYPNPARKSVTVNTKTPFIQIQLYNTEGILRKSYNYKGTTTTLDISTLKPGVYYLLIASKNGTQTEKLIVL